MGSLFGDFFPLMIEEALKVNGFTLWGILTFND